MSILRLERVRREIGTFVILDGVVGAIAHGDRVGLVGENGAGKTTLLKLIAGVEDPDGGGVARKRGLRIGFLAQETNFDATVVGAPTVRAAVRGGAAELERLERELAAMEAAGAEVVGSQRYAELQGRFESGGGYTLDQRVEETLSGLGFEREEWERPPTALSGGQQTRAALARLMVADPDLLLLDEPTNHLDVAALEWLEQALVRRDRALLVASHDRAFLDAVVVRVWELRDRRLAAFRGDYSAYLLQREAADARQRKDAESQAEAIAREQELVQRYRSHRKYAKMHEHERRLEALQESRVDGPRKRGRVALPGQALLGGAARSAELVVSLRDAVVGFPATPARPEGIPILRVPRLEATRGDRIGIVGPNGAGKTTLLRTVAGQLAPLDGVLRVGTGVAPAYLAQVRSRGATGATVLDTVLDAAALDTASARSYLARFLFRGEDVFKPVTELSGGERSRLELAVLGVLPSNLLLLDEPTNHLDIPAREALESFLLESPATLLIVSHDRRLLETVCERLWVVEPGSDGEPGRAVAFEGGWRAWREAVSGGWSVASELEVQARRLDPWAAATATRARAATTGSTGNPAIAGKPANAGATATARKATRTGATAGPAGNGATARAGSGTSAARQPPLSKDAYKRQKALIEGDLDRLGRRKSHLELALGDAGLLANFVELRRVTSELADVDEALARAEEAWLILEERAPR